MRSVRPLGYTLIELLVVLFIISIVAGVAVLSISHRRDQRMEAFVNDFTQLLTLAEEQAMLQPATLRVAFNPKGFQFDVYQPKTAQQKSLWRPLADTLLNAHTLPEGVAISMKGEPLTEKQPQLIVSMNGDVTPFTLYVGKQGDKPTYSIVGDANGHVTSQRLG